MFLWRRLNLWISIVINIKLEIFSKWQVHIYHYFSCIFKNNMTLFLWVWIWNSFQTVNYTVCFALQRLNLWNALVINIKQEHYSTCRISFHFLIITWIYSCDFECKIELQKSSECFAWRCLIFSIAIVINIKPELFSTWQVHIYHYFSCIFINNMT
jgi:hypothetical protein